MDAAITRKKPWWQIFEPYHWVVFIVASMAWLIDCLNQQLFNLARDGAVTSMLGAERATEYAPYSTSVFLLGWAIGGLILGSLGDRYGRARMLLAAVLMYGICTGLTTFADSFPMFCVCLLITGIGVGGVFGLTVALVSDSVPEETRAPALGILQSCSSFGNIAVGLIGMGIGYLAFHHLLGDLPPWRVLFAIGAVPALALAPFFAKVKEPEKWVAARARGAAMGIKFGSYGSLLLKPKWRKHAWLGLIACSAGIIGLWGIGNFHPVIVRSLVAAHLANSGLSPEEISSQKATWGALGLLLQNLGGFCGMFLLSKLAQVKGRRIAFALALTLSFVFTVMVFEFMRDISQIYWMLPLMGFGQYSVFGVYAIYLPELFPTSLRSTGTSFCYNFGRLLAATAPFTIGQVTRSLGGNIEAFRTGGIAVSFVLLLGIFVLPFLPETKGLTLPDDTV